ncbi:MAG: hypothetical protein M3N10_02600 [Actinomycetota bacterium]|nr:hypothetical protein [Actinomycetota bacterium]HZY65019.1 hypothetical protein [Rubrobacteraceae bacterium]
MIEERSGAAESRATTRGVEERGRRTRPWPVTALGGILLSQAVFAAVLGAAKLGASGLGWLGPVTGDINLLAAAGLILLAPVALLAAVGFFRLWSSAWTLGMGIQGLGLLVALGMYFYYPDVPPAYVYAGMAYHILTVVYLNSHGVQTAFRVRTSDEYRS